MRIDIIIPVYRNLELIIRCINSNLEHTFNDNLYDINIIIVDDSFSNELSEILENYITSLDNYNLIYIKNNTNLGFIGSCYNGIEYRESDFKILLNSDTYVTNNWLKPMITLANSSEDIAMVNPVTNNSPIIDVPFGKADNFVSLTKKISRFNLDNKDKKLYLDVVTATGFCLLIKSSVIEKYGFFDKIYDKGYCEETDLYFRYVSQGLRAVLCLDSFVYHRGEGSFDERDERLNKNCKILWSRYKDLYDSLINTYKEKTVLNEVRKYVNINTVYDYDVIILSPHLKKGSGGIKILHNICTYLIESGISANIVLTHSNEKSEIIDSNYSPILFSEFIENGFTTKAILFSLDVNCYDALVIKNYLKTKHQIIPHIVSLLQDIEGFFEGRNYEDSLSCIKIAQSYIFVSSYLMNYYSSKIEDSKKLQLIENPISLNFLNAKVRKKGNKFILTAMMRADTKRGAVIILEALKLLDKEIINEIEFNWVGNFKSKYSFKNIKVNEIEFLDEKKLISLLSETHLYIDSSFFHGFGLGSLEAIFSGCKVLSTLNAGANSVLENSDSVNYFQIGDSNDLKSKIKKIIEKGVFDILPLDMDLIYRFSRISAKNNYVNFFRNLLNSQVKEDLESEYNALFRKSFPLESRSKINDIFINEKPYRYKVADYLHFTFVKNTFLENRLRKFFEKKLKN